MVIEPVEMQAGAQRGNSHCELFAKAKSEAIPTTIG